MEGKEQDNAGVIAPPPLIYLSGLLSGLWLQSKLPVPWLPRRLRTTLGGTLVGAAIILFAACLRLMRRANTNIAPTQPTTALIVEGPYQVTRNPIYLALTMFYTGVALLFNAFWSLLLLPLVIRIINFGVIDREERYLEHKFGDRYRQYKEKVARWF
ncbi:MAG: isoprenylcysteine carboxylmethyltransferase family protein [Ktedonobacteraceae bacterium]|nr:isoprenylcysteine carboxylmethyltransferase family protein [Ktedonobacteraceae bacterium]MBO0796276.1 isoprenylcysteine carboxylmethyltransferase family protein [Ktedonobacteraceae bacterium]